MSKLREDLSFRHAVEDLVTVVARLTGPGEVETRVLGLRLRHRRFDGGAAVWKPDNNDRVAERWATWEPAVDPL